MTINNIINFIINSPLDQFETQGLINLQIPVVGDFIISLTNLGLYSLITIGLIIGLHVIANNNNRLVPSAWSVAIESVFATIQSIVRSQIGEKAENYFPFIYSVFFFILIANLNGNIPYGYTITTSVITAIGLSVIVFLGVTILIISLHGFHSFSFFVPSGTPLALVPILVLIELISYFARAVSLGVRLFSNIVSGHTLLAILSTFLGQLFTASILIATLTLILYAIFVFLIVLEMAVSLIQSYVFSVLLCSYIKDAKELH